MTTETANVTHIQDATTARWLARTLEPVRARVLSVPSDEAIERIRARVLGERPGKSRTLAA